MKLSVIIVNYNVRAYLEQCLRTVFEALKGVEGDVFVVDNQSTDGSVEMVREKFPQVKLIANRENVGFSRANNQAIRESTAEYVLLLNPDTVVGEDVFTKVVAFLDAHPKAGGLGVVDHSLGRLWLVHSIFLPEGRALSPVQLERLYRQGQDRLRRYAVAVQKAVHRRKSWGDFSVANLKSNRSEAAYQLMVRRAKGFIASGDMYQCNLSQNFSAAWSGDPWTLYRDLTQINPSPYAALWRSGTRWMVSASPELLLRLEAGRVETRPIAGTYPRRAELSNDRWQSQALLQDAKERAEHIMLVDLERNDLGRVCLPSTVRVSEALTQEIYSHVIHLVSDVRGTLCPGRHWKDLLQATFPGGTITGCPKIRAMELIHKLEPHRRGPYTGSLGWIGFAGDATFNILIRTMFIDKDRLSFPVGAGIVADSDPAREYQETLHKAGALLEALRTPMPANVKARRSL